MLKTRLTRSGSLPIWISAALVGFVCVVRYIEAPSFWLDEAFVAVSLRDPSAETIFAPLRYSQYFPRLYLGAIAALRELLGYQIWIIRLLPSLAFIIATLLWARLLAKRAGHSFAAGLIAAALFLGATFWLEQAIMLKQYTLDVLVALIPFLIGDDFFNEALACGKRKKQVWLLAVPCVISYSYPIALGARVAGWYISRASRRQWSLSATGLVALAMPVLLGLAIIWATDHQFNLKDRDAYLAYWNNCTLASRFNEGIGSGLKLIGEFLWGWHHGRLMPVVIAVLAPLQALGVYRVILRWRNREDESFDGSWGSRTIGSLALIVAVIAASAVVSYPLCAGRLVLFAQVHLQILAVEGALFIISSWNRSKAALAFLSAAIAVVSLYSGHRYVDFLRSEPGDNIRPMLPLIKREVANTVWVHPCSAAQVESLPDALPVERVLIETRRHAQMPAPGERTWILWTNLSDDYCRERLNEIRSRAVSWQMIHEGPSRGLALAQF